MPNSLKCKIKHLCYNRTITERERDRILKALEQQDILDKIRSEIEEHAEINQNLNIDRARALCWCLDIIDKYKSESEYKE